MASKIDFEQLRKEVKKLHRWQPLYKLLKEELSKRGYWKLHTRGDPKKAYTFGWGKKRNVENH